MKKIAIRRLKIIPVAKGDGIAPRHQLVVFSELASMGVRIVNPEVLKKAAETFFLDYHDVTETLRGLRGGDVDHVPLFSGFPENVPDDGEYFARRVFGYLGNVLGAFDEGVKLENGIVIPSWLFDPRDFGADPVTQFQTKTSWESARTREAKREEDDHTEWLDVELVWADEVLPRLSTWMQSCFYSKSSIKEALHEDLNALLSHFGPDRLDFAQVAMKENQALLLRLLWEAGREEEVGKLARTPTDVLRLFAALTASDISLAKPIRFPKLSRRQRRVVFSILEGASGLEEDLNRYRGLWLEIGRYMHPGEFQKKYPRTAGAFDTLRNGRIRTFDSHTERLLLADDVEPVLKHLAGRPGVLARKLHEILRRFPGSESTVLASFAEVGRDMPIKSLLVLQSYFASINRAEFRTVINKRGKIKVLPNNAKGALTPGCLDQVERVLRECLEGAIREKESWEGRTVWVDPKLEDYTVPLQQRAASDGLLSVGRGSKIGVDFDKVLRVFVYWKQTSRRTDLDLSVIQFDEEFKYAGHVSYTNLSSRGIAHSGDIQSAPFGAAEFIDITLMSIPGNVRYLAVQVYRYAGEEFAEMQCHAGWMTRSKVDSSYKSFDIKTVVNKFDLNGTGGYCVPLVVDLRERKAIITDIYMGTKAFHNNVEGAYGNIAMVSREVSRFTTTRPVMKTLADLHVTARGARPGDSAQADITFGIEGCTFNATEVETVLSELL